MRLGSRIYLGMAGLSLGIVLSSLLLSALFLGPFYLARKKAELGTIAERIGPLPEEISALSSILLGLERSSSVHISIIGKDGRLLYDSHAPLPGGATPLPGGATPLDAAPPPAPTELPDRGLPFPSFREAAPPPGLFQAAGPPGGEGFRETMDPRTGVRLLSFARRATGGRELILSFPLAEIEESARAAAFFVAVSGLAALILAAGLALLVSRGVTKPFGELVAVSRSLAAFDFSARFRGRGDEETVALGGTMNELAASLEKALTELEARNAKLEEDIEKERRIDAMRREFVASVSHELKTPIALIQGYAEGLVEEVPTGPEDRLAYLEVIVDEARKMDRQVRDLLELSQLDSGTMPLRPASIDLAILAAESLTSFARPLAERGVRLERALRPALAMADRDLVERAFVNYLTNAIEHVLPGGIILVESGLEGEGAFVSVFNEGKHIPEEALDRLWDSYYKVDPSRNRCFGGTGLGLAIVRGIALRLGGSCGVENLAAAEGRAQGLRFVLRLPAAPA
ncbi:MAG TPA: histidine kinase dimerization/phospho-acceptor domain-containing protein [Rectinemataceae bacterium]|nr:histidine kinase dimerization/phospho-acceptor domain-containing protein [Rectinemataceae bacterium]